MGGHRPGLRPVATGAFTIRETEHHAPMRLSLRRFLLAATASLALVGAALPAHAIPEEDAVAKLGVVVVFVVMGEQGQPAFVNMPDVEDKVLLPMYMTRELANEALQVVRNTEGGEGSRLLLLPLTEAIKLNEDLAKQLTEKTDKNLVISLVPSRQDLDLATSILIKQGAKKEDIDLNLQVPVFYTYPPLTITLPDENKPRVALFFNYSQLQKARSEVEEFEGEDRVMDWRQAFNLIVQEPDDKFFLHPTQDFLDQVRNGIPEQQILPQQILPQQILPQQS